MLPRFAVMTCAFLCNMFIMTFSHIVFWKFYDFSWQLGVCLVFWSGCYWMTGSKK